MSLEEFNVLPPEDARERVAGCLDVPRWVEAVVAGRPYPSIADALAVAERESEHLDHDELAGALARHPRIGERPTAGRHDAARSSREQSGVEHDDPDVARRLADGNRAYERRFDRVFLIRAAGRDAGEVLGELARRLTNDEETERAETVEQMQQIALLRLREVLSR